MPAQKISSANAISTSASDSQVETKPDGRQRRRRQAEIDQHDHDQRRQRAEQVDDEDDQPVERPDAELRISARTSPAASPVTTMQPRQLDGDDQAREDVGECSGHDAGVEEGVEEPLPGGHSAGGASTNTWLAACGPPSPCPLPEGEEEGGASDALPPPPAALLLRGRVRRRPGRERSLGSAAARVQVRAPFSRGGLGFGQLRSDLRLRAGAVVQAFLRRAKLSCGERRRVPLRPARSRRRCRTRWRRRTGRPGWGPT